MLVKVKDTAQLGKWAGAIYEIRSEGISHSYPSFAIAFITFVMRAMDALLKDTPPNPILFPTGLVPDQENWTSAWSIWADGMYNKKSCHVQCTSQADAPRPFVVNIYPHSRIKLPKDVTEFEFVNHSNAVCLKVPPVPPAPDAISPVVDIVDPPAEPSGAGITNRTFTFASGGDTNGVFRAMGMSAGGNFSFFPPISQRYISAFSSSTTSDAGLENLIVRNVAPWSSEVANTFILFNIAKSFDLRIGITKYAMKSGTSSTNLPRNWTLHGTDDVVNGNFQRIGEDFTAATNAAATWTLLDERINDTTIALANQYGIFTPNRSQQLFRVIKLTVTGPASDGINHISLNELEFYGLMGNFPPS